MIKVKGGCVVSEVENNHPLLSVIPCSLAAACQNLRVAPSDSRELNELLKARLDAEDVVIGQNCRESLRGVLDALGVKSIEDEVAVFTTSGKPYLSGCVSKAIDEAGAWTREAVSAKTKAILIVHEFGYPYQDISKFRAFGLPIIEDAAFSFNSRFIEGDLVGTRGDYAVFSFSKFFDIQVGGASVRLSPTVPALPDESGADVIKYVKGVVLDQYAKIERYSLGRTDLFEYYVKRFKRIGIVPYFENDTGVIPGVFLFSPPSSWDLFKLKEFLWSRGVQCTVFYGEHAFYLPLHHGMKEETVDYLHRLIEGFLDEK